MKKCQNFITLLEVIDNPDNAVKMITELQADNTELREEKDKAEAENKTMRKLLRRIDVFLSGLKGIDRKEG